MPSLRPVDLAQEHGISPQTVRNYEREGFLPPAERTASGYRRYTERHAAALRAYLAMARAHGYSGGATIMRAVTGGRLDDALAAVDRSHAELLRDRGTLDAVGEVLAHLRKRAGDTDWRAPRTTPQPFTSGEVARRLGVSVATLRAWERAGVLAPGRRQDANHRTYDADDIRDAELAHFLRRGHYSLELIATVVRQVRTAGDTQALETALEDWRRRVTARGVAMLRAAALLSAYLASEDGPS
ncbi:MerR family transcriptional regulator [Streptomyces sp. NPDC085466]|uniref:MerR family transcriptional regulator n=1 Tax=Streptomyces sp. NPDC085466 TaxID=3365725 RepID=UPI0037CD027E